MFSLVLQVLTVDVVICSVEFTGTLTSTTARMITRRKPLLRSVRRIQLQLPIRSREYKLFPLSSKTLVDKMDNLKNGLVFFDHLKKKTRELYRLVHERSDRFWFSNRYSFLSVFFLLSPLCGVLCQLLLQILFFPLKHRDTFQEILAVFCFVFLLVPILMQWEWQILCAKTWPCSF